MNRRRFITISAAAVLATTAQGAPARWRGRAMGGEVSLTLYGGTQADLDSAVNEIDRIEKIFSIYDSDSEISRLNRNGGGRVSTETARLLALCDQVCTLTDNLFDPTIQPVFRAALEGRVLPWHLVGWDRLRLDQGRLYLAPDQEITLNGIAQGYATDRVRNLLAARGFTKALVSVGEHSAIGGPFRLALEDPQHGYIGMRTVADSTIATSSPGAMSLGKRTHILHPNRNAAPLWSTVSVEAKSAALADGLSTALCMAPRDLTERVASATGTRITLVSRDGDLTRLG